MGDDGGELLAAFFADFVHLGLWRKRGNTIEGNGFKIRTRLGIHQILKRRDAFFREFVV